MGNSATGYIFFGIGLEDDAKPWDEDDEGLEPTEIYIEKIYNFQPHGLEFTYDYGKHTNWQYVKIWTDPSKAKEGEKALEAWYDKKHQLEKQCPIAIGYSGCRDNYSTPFLYIKESKMDAEWSEFKEINPEKFIIKPEWRDILKEACEVLNIPFQEPKFYLTASYG